MQGEPLTIKDRIEITVLLIICLTIYALLYKIGFLTFLFKAFIIIFIVGLLYNTFYKFYNKKKNEN